MVTLITEFGAVGDGKTLCTKAIQSAIDKTAVGGGRVVVPEGRFLTGTISLRSRVTLELSYGAVLLGSPRIEDYPADESALWPHQAFQLVRATECDHVAIVGEGAIEGNGPAFWEPDRLTEWHFWREKNQRPGSMVRFSDCRHVRIENVTLRHAAGWTLHCRGCEQLRITGLVIRNTYFGPNTDGMDIQNCRGVVIHGCDVETGDDAIAVMATKHGGPSEDIVISDCILKTSCVGVRIIGFDAGAVHRRIMASNLVIPRCSRLFDIRAMNGSTIENVNVAGVVGTTNCGWAINRPIEINATDSGDLRGEMKTAPNGLIRDVSVSNVDVVTDGRSIIVASAHHHVQNIALSNIRVRYAMLDDPSTAADSQDILFIPGDHREARGTAAALVAENVEGLTVRGFSIVWPSYPVSDTWLLLSTPWPTILSPSIYEGKIEKVRAGKQRPTFKAFWGRKLRGALIDLRGIGDSEGGSPASISSCERTIVRTEWA